MRLPDRSRRRFAALTVVAFALGLAAAPQTVSAQAADQPNVDQFGGIIASARGNAIQATYDSPNLVATGSPVLQFSIPEALANLSSGPVGFARASFLFPGPLIADLDAALTASGNSTGIPPYPVRAEAYYPAGPTSASDGQAGAAMTASTEFADSRARGTYAGLDLDPAAYIGSVDARSQSVVRGDRLFALSRTEVTNFSFAGGLFAADSIVTDLEASSDGTSAASSGRTTVSGATVLGLPVTVDKDGVSFVDRPSDPEPDPDNPIGDALGDVDGGVTDTLTAPLNELLQQVGGAGDEALQQLFEQSGIEITLADPVESVDGSLATRSSSGLSITMNYDGQNTPVFSDLFGLVPVADLPAENVGPIPFSPQAIVRLFEKVHIMRFAVAIGDVSVQATPAFVFEAPVFVPPTPRAPSESTTRRTTRQTTSRPASTPSAVAPTPPQQLVAVPASSDFLFAWGTAVPALLILGALFGAPFIGIGTTRMADNALSEIVTTCPDGLDGPVGGEDRS